MTPLWVPLQEDLDEAPQGLLTLWSKALRWRRFTGSPPSLWPDARWCDESGDGVWATVDIDISSVTGGGFIPVRQKSANTWTPSSDWSYSRITSRRYSIEFSPLGTLRPMRPRWRATSLGEPWKMSSPRASTMRWSRSIRMRCDGWWMVRITVLPLRAMWCTLSMTLWALVESRPEVGSSRKSNEGPCIMSTPIDTRRRSPPDTPRVPSSPMNVFLDDCNNKI